VYDLKGKEGQMGGKIQVRKELDGRNKNLDTNQI
jgi:hypothetical protein